VYAAGAVIERALPPVFDTARFAVRQAELGDATEIARVQTQSWQTSYRGILPDSILDTMNVARRAAKRREILLDTSALNLVAYDVTHRDLVGFCNAGPSRRQGPLVGELYEIYIVEYAKRYGLGRELFESALDWCRENEMTQMIVWVLENNHHARRFYDAMGGAPSGRVQSAVRGYPVIELSYLYRL
jgi:GNAT superfamily N-acetyltransferase